ncbi:hypothetical protein M569_10346, partial [Genlisea aurea]
SFTCFSSKKKKKQQLGFVDRILDYIEGGPKLRKWYGAPDLRQKQKDEANDVNEDLASDLEETRDAVLVTDGDNEIGQSIILSLVVKRIRVKALVKDKRAALEAFGTYVESLVGDANDKRFLKRASTGVRAVICPTAGFLSKIEDWKGIQHVILLSQLSFYRNSTGIQALVTSSSRELVEGDEDAVKNSGVPYTIIRTGNLVNSSPANQQGFSFQKGVSAQGSLRKEDAAFICVEALDHVPSAGLTFEVVNGGEKVSDWKTFFSTL